MTVMDMRKEVERLSTQNALMRTRLEKAEEDQAERQRDMEAEQREADKDLERAYKLGLENVRLRQQVQDIRDLLGQSRRRVQAVKADLRLTRDLLAKEQKKTGVEE